MTEQPGYEPVRVHITGSDVDTTAPRRTHGLIIVTRTIVLTAANPVQDLASYDPAREYLLLQVFGNNAVLCSNNSQATDAANQASGLPNPNGTLLTTGQVIPVKAINRLWVAAAAYPTQVSVIIAHRAE